ncbi:MAG: glycosyltransferase family 4 protein, partial [bacterium]|nr:glycosyltransferase family 4 protein [bacterium]
MGLDAAGCETTNVLLDCTPTTFKRLPLPAMVRSGSVRRIAASIRRFGRGFTPDRTYQRSMREMRSFAEIASRKIEEKRFDVVVATNMSGLVSHIESSLPIIYATDATAMLANTVYSTFRSRRRGAREAASDLETRAAARADLILVPSDYCRASMCLDHGAESSKVHVVPLGANLVPESNVSPEEISAPMVEGELELVVVAADPERKRVGLCVEVAEMLEERGWRTRLHYIGPRHAICNRSVVEWAGPLNHGVES